MFVVVIVVVIVIVVNVVVVALLVVTDPIIFMSNPTAVLRLRFGCDNNHLHFYRADVCFELTSPLQAELSSIEALPIIG